MGIAVRQRVAELAEQTEVCKRKTARIRRRSSLVMARADQIIWSQTPYVSFLQGPVPHGMPADADQEREPDEAHVSEDGQILKQVERLLRTLGQEDLERWSDDDECLLFYLEEAWKAAARKGYTLEDIQTVLRSLARVPD